MASKTRQTRLATGADAACIKCHVDKQGPFTYEHAPVKTEGCTACHTPHGSANPRLLRYSAINQLCLTCHSVAHDVGAIEPAGPQHNQNAQYANCTACHVKIHGSRTESRFLPLTSCGNQISVRSSAFPRLVLKAELQIAKDKCDEKQHEKPVAHGSGSIVRTFVGRRYGRGADQRPCEEDSSQSRLIRSPLRRPLATDAGDYTINSSIEFGYRGIRVDGDEQKYRSDLNYKAGPRIFDSSFLMQSKDGKGGLFDTLLVTASGCGADPTGSLRISVEKPKWYRFEGHLSQGQVLPVPQ